MSQRFRDRELSRLRNSGWVGNHRLPSPLNHLAEMFTDAHWESAERSVALLAEKFAEHRFASDVEYGLLLVPSPDQLDTRGPVPLDLRRAQHPDLGDDFLDPALPEGVDLTSSGVEWTVFASIVGRYGISAGSYDQIVAAPAEQFTVDGVDTRTGMTRQLWGARLLQAPPGLIPDSDYNDTWTFTLFPGEPTVDGQAASGTVLKGRVRFRLGKTNRGIGSARVAPALPIDLRP